MIRCHLCGSIKRRCYIRASRNGRRTYLAIGWLCLLCKIFSYEHEKLYHLAISPKRKPKMRCSCGSAMLRLYVKEPKTQRFIAIGWLCLREFSHTTETLDLKALNAEG